MLRNRRNGLVALLILLMTFGASFAGIQAQGTGDSDKDNTPEGAVRRSLEARQTGDVDGEVRLLHPDTLSDYKKAYAELFEGLTAEMAPEWFRVKDRAEYNKLSGAQLYTRSYKLLTAMFPGMAEEAKTEREKRGKEKILGHFVDGTDTAYVVVVFPKEIREPSRNKGELYTVKRKDGKWLVMLEEDILEFPFFMKLMMRRAKPDLSEHPSQQSRKQRR